MSTPAAFVAIYAGATVAEARLLAAASDTDLVEIVATRLLKNWPPGDADPIANALADGRRQALELIAGGSPTRPKDKEST